MKFAGAVIFLILTANLVAAEYVFEFGVNNGQIIYNKDANIPLLTWNTDVTVPVPLGMSVTYVKVTVRSLSPPKVDYDPMYNRVSIKFSWTQVTLATYNILAKATYMH